MLKTLFRYVLTVWAASVVVFTLLRIIPGDPAEIALGVTATPETLAAKRAQLGTDQPLWNQYWDWILGLLRGDFGISLTSGAQLSPIITDRMQVSLIVVSLSMLVAVIVAIPLGMWAALRNRHADGIIISAVVQVGIAVPSFLAAILLVSVFSVNLGWLPANGWVPPGYDFGGFFKRLVLPVGALAAVQAAISTRYVRSAVLEIISDDFLRTARAKGLTTTQALVRHGMRNAAIPVLTVLGMQLSTLVVGAVVIERVFTIPGLGSLLLDSVVNRDIIAVQTIVMLLVLFTLLVNMLVDVATLIIDPRLRKKA
ncbi:ABC transporter permease [Corynebacterium epidermidicanis]|uniref:ABC-type dipeptide/oligopeptide/nickel transport system, permease component n=1 Tax=Corynebacterium epidermidicanis TaxID=1050174 RepID=A0A0G3GXW7_9CORY|nr:ABC transporter permease [Corynebacterium epidermidicanis]AKK03657.1 ABC-type dipeptide/oligopeptide/nickel transport system, permease component [Corynebacterium epidermidicanis]